MGCIETSSDPKIIRLTYENQKATAREVETDIIRQFNAVCKFLYLINNSKAKGLSGFTIVLNMKQIV